MRKTNSSDEEFLAASERARRAERLKPRAHAHLALNAAVERRNTLCARKQRADLSTDRAPLRRAVDVRAGARGGKAKNIIITRRQLVNVDELHGGGSERGSFAIRGGQHTGPARSHCVLAAGSAQREAERQPRESERRVSEQTVTRREEKK